MCTYPSINKNTKWIFLVNCTIDETADRWTVCTVHVIKPQVAYVPTEASCKPASNGCINCVCGSVSVFDSSASDWSLDSPRTPVCSVISLQSLSFFLLSLHVYEAESQDTYQLLHSSWHNFIHLHLCLHCPERFHIYPCPAVSFHWLFLRKTPVGCTMWKVFRIRLLGTNLVDHLTDWHCLP